MRTHSVLPARASLLGTLLLAVSLAPAIIACDTTGAVSCEEDPTQAQCIPTPEPEPETCSEANPCPDGEECNGDGRCVTACVEGTISCPCGRTGCDDGLECSDDDICVEAECAPGAVGCACFADLTCAPAEGGEMVFCDDVTRRCRFAEDTTESPGVPSLDCYTPCEESITGADGTFRYCSPEGLMEGCLSGLECVQGSCVGDGSAPPICETATDCPTHQNCIEGYCLSNCDFDSDCESDAICDAKVCRKVCSASAGAVCPPNFTCRTLDGEEGVCQPLSPVSEPPPPVEADEFIVSTSEIFFTNTRVSALIEIENTSDRAITFTINKIEHAEVTDDGRTVITENPLFWLEMGESGEEERQASYEMEVLPHSRRNVSLTSAFNGELDRWEGRLEITAPRQQPVPIRLEYSTTPAGQWAGTIHYFINFDDKDIFDWRDAIKNGPIAPAQSAAIDTENALLVQWTQFRKNPLFNKRRFDAMIAATLNGAWNYGNVKDACEEENGSNALCYLYADGSPSDPGLRVYTDNNALRIPTGIIDMPFAVRLQPDRDDAEGRRFVGRVESPSALQYPGLPPVTLEFGADPKLCEDPTAEACTAPVSTFDATVLVGGRSLREEGQASCPTLTQQVQEVPWLVPHFYEGTVYDGETGRRFRQECRESTFPIAAQSNQEIKLNMSLAGANPIPDGRTRRRIISVLDGVMVNQDALYLLVQERFEANLGRAGEGDNPADFSAYAIVILSRSGDDLDADDFTPGVVNENLDEAPSMLDLTCSEDILDEFIAGEPVAGNEDKLARTLLYGVDDTSTITPVAQNRVHYLCHSTGRFDGGLPAWDADGGEACPISSGVTYFIYDGPVDLRRHECQGVSADRCTCIDDGEGNCLEVDCPENGVGTCADQLAILQSNRPDEIFVDPPFMCDDGTGTPLRDGSTCSVDDNRFDLRDGRLFFAPSANDAPVFEPLQQFIDEAFRYKTRFRSRSGGNIGFVPAKCELDSSVLPYCYDPVDIEKARARMDCLVSIYASDALPLGSNLRNDLKVFLEGNFSFFTDRTVDPPRTDDGFERLYSELLIMLGDDALTGAVASRFDLAGSSVASFEGDLLEPDGIRLSGGAGNEMVLLYRAQQYFQLVLDRFYRLTPTLWEGLETPGNNFVTLDSISTYFNRLILASTKKARVASEIARRYQAFNRADLARHVIERSYSEAYLESIAISQFMKESVRVLNANELDALQFELTLAQRQYRQAMQRMRETYEGITDEVTFFGDAPDYIPFPADGSFDLPPPTTMINRAFETLQVAKEREVRALESNRAFDVDAAQFQSELARIRQQYENELADICGEFVAANGTAYPAIPKYATLSPVAAALGDPCGYLGTGQISDALKDLEARALDLRSEVQDMRDIFRRVAIEEDRVEQECNGRVAIADIQFDAAGSILTLRDQINEKQNQIAAWDKILGTIDREIRVTNSVGQTASAVSGGFAGCAGGFGGNPAACVAGTVAAGVAAAAFGVATVQEGIGLGKQNAANDDITAKENEIRSLEEQIAELDRSENYQSAISECCLDPGLDPGEPVSASGCQNPGPLVVNSRAQVDQYLIDLLRGEIEARRAQVELQRSLGRLQSLRKRAVRLYAQQDETEQHLINVEAARNDPNIRIYANADVLSADRTFQDALTDAYRATRMFEYYTAQSYAKKGDLFLVRLAGRGEDNLEDYLLDLRRAFNDFEQDFGRPSLRVQLVSLRDDILRIPRTKEDGTAMSKDDQIQALHDRLKDPNLLDDRGYIRIPFNTSLDAVSPITSIHKLAYVEAEVHGTDLGDRIIRLYLTSKGTSSIRALDGSVQYHRMDPVTAVLNGIKGGNRTTLGPEVYRDTRLKDRPLVNSLYELTINFKDEQVNEDFNINSIDDVLLFLYYEDFAQL